MGLKTTIKRKYNLISNKLKYKKLVNTRKKLIEKLSKTNKKIKVAFLGYALGSSCDIFSNIYKEFKQDERFEPYVVIVPNSYGKKEIMLELMHQAQEYLDKLNIPYICGYDEKEDKFVDIIKEINPDIVFMTHHYDWFHKNFRIESFKEKLVYLTPYAIFLEKGVETHCNSQAYLLAHKCFFETKGLADAWSKNSIIKENKEGEFLGYLKTDNLLFPNKNFKDDWKIKDKKVKRIIWAPHHLDAPLSNFLEYKDFFLNLAKSNKNIQFAFRPHPGLKGSLSRIAKWDEDEIEKYWIEWENLDNGFISNGEYIDLFFTSDAMILDSISFTAEYLFTGKPLLSQKPKMQDFPFNDFGLELKKNLYQSSNWDEVLDFINEVVIKENDSMKEQRDKFFRENFIPPNNRSAANSIYIYIVSELFNN